jgi:glutathione S-transferase
MSLTLYYHPLSSFCWKALIALYETETPFTPHLVDLGDPKDAAAFKAIWPIGKFPVLREDKTGAVIPESSIIIEYLEQHGGRAIQLIPDDPERAREARLRDRVFDLYVHQPMQRIVADRLRPAEAKDAFGVAAARDQLGVAYAMIERELEGRRWACGEAFGIADCAASPALHYADKLAPISDFPNLAAYLKRLMARPAFARVLAEAAPYFAMFPQEQS